MATRKQIVKQADPKRADPPGLRQIKDLLRSVQELKIMISQDGYAPSPMEAVELRAGPKPFRQEPTLVNVFRDPNVANVRGLPIYTSESLNTKGYTQHNAFVGIQIISDSAPDDGGERLLLTIVLEGACGSPWVELDAVTINSDGTARSFTVPLLASDSLALSTRVVVYAGDNYPYQQPPAVARQIEFTIDGMIVSGQGFS